jgi:hypothetical protein
MQIYGRIDNFTVVFWVCRHSLPECAKQCQKLVNIGVMRKDRAAQQRLFSGTIMRGLTQPLNAYGYKYFSLLLLLFYPFVVPADLSQQAKSAAADGLTQLTKKCG